jgi:hypothetical protein
MTTYDNPEFDDPNPPEESSNRTFLLVAGILGGLVLLGLLCIGGYLFWRNSSNQQVQANAIAQATQQASTVQAGVTQTLIAQNLTQTAAVTNTVPPTNTPVIAEATATSSPTPGAATVTVAAAFTQLAVSTQTVIATSTALPNTGFVDEFGAPGLMLAAVALVAVIFLVRRLRSSPS